MNNELRNRDSLPQPWAHRWLSEIHRGRIAPESIHTFRPVLIHTWCIGYAGWCVCMFAGFVVFTLATHTCIAGSTATHLLCAIIRGIIITELLLTIIIAIMMLTIMSSISSSIIISSRVVLIVVVVVVVESDMHHCASQNETTSQ